MTLLLVISNTPLPLFLTVKVLQGSSNLEVTVILLLQSPKYDYCVSYHVTFLLPPPTCPPPPFFNFARKFFSFKVRTCVLTENFSLQFTLVIFVGFVLLSKTGPFTLGT